MTKEPIVLISYLQKGEKREKRDFRTVGFQILSLEREYLTSLYIYKRSDRRQSSGQEGKMLYAERASRGYRI